VGSVLFLTKQLRVGIPYATPEQEAGLFKTALEQPRTLDVVLEKDKALLSKSVYACIPAPLLWPSTESAEFRHGTGRQFVLGRRPAPRSHCTWTAATTGAARCCCRSCRKSAPPRVHRCS
jgi:hypothetical protein